jgi:hypothetical protein
MTSQPESLTPAKLGAPSAAAVAGIVFSVLLLIVFGLFRSVIPADPLESGSWLSSDVKTAAVALNLIPFAGVAFLWFIGVLRDRLGQQEDKFFATVFLGSALLFLAMLFSAAAAIGGLVYVSAVAGPVELINSPTFRLARALSYILVNVYAIKMAVVFMISTSTVIIYTAITPRWIAVLGFVSALLLLVGSYYNGWVIVVLPGWILLISIYILIDNLRRSRQSRVRTSDG